MAEKYDVFVGNLTFNTSEEQLRELFQFIGPVKNVRILTDKETGKPKGFAFVEYFDTNSALSAIKHLDQAELNGRKIKVGYPSQSNLKDIARQIGHVVGEESGMAGSSSGGFSIAQFQQRQQQELSIINSLKLHEAWDLLDAMKTLVMDDSKAEKVRALLETHPQIVSAIYQIEKRLGIPLPAHIQQQLSNPFSSQPNPVDFKDGVISSTSYVNVPSAYGVEGDYYGPSGQVMSEEEMLMMQQQAPYYGGDVRMMMGNDGSTGFRNDAMDIYGPGSAGGVSGQVFNAQNPPGRVSRFGAPDHANLLPNVGSGGNEAYRNQYVDQYGNEFYPQEYGHQYK